jgi:DNA-binding beta-propeller fold protein YncE
LIAVAVGAAATAEGLNHTTGTRGLLLIDKLGGHVRFFDPATFAERSNIELPKNPHDFALSADHRFAYVPIYGPGVYNRNPEPGHELYVIDLAERKVAKAIDLTPYRSPHGVQIDSSGLLYVTAELERKVLVVDPMAGRVVDTIDHEGSGHWLALLPDGSKAYVANKDDKPFVTVLDLKARKQIGRVPMP